MSTYLKPISCLRSKHTIRSTAGLAFAVERSQIACVRRVSYSVWRSLLPDLVSARFVWLFRRLSSISPLLSARSLLLNALLLRRIWRDPLRLRDFAGGGASPKATITSCVRLLRFVLRGDLGKLVVILVLVALKKLEFAALRNGVGNDLRIRWEYGRAVTGSGS